MLILKVKSGYCTHAINTIICHEMNDDYKGKHQTKTLKLNICLFNYNDKYWTEDTLQVTCCFLPEISPHTYVHVLTS